MDKKFPDICHDTRRDVMPPLAIDLYSGLGSGQAELVRCADPAVEESMAGRTEDPNHMPPRVGGNAPSSVAFVRWLVRNLEDARFAARLTGLRQVCVSAAKAAKNCVFSFSLPGCLIPRSTLFVFTPCPQPPQFARGLNRTLIAAIPSICAWGNDGEMYTAPPAIPALLRRALMLVSPDSSGALSAIAPAPLFVWTHRLECTTTELTGQVVHRKIITR